MNKFLSPFSFLFVLVIAASLIGNIYTLRKYKIKPPVVKSDTVMVTFTLRDTVFQEVVKYYSVERPVPVMVYDTVKVLGEFGVKEYRDTVIHEYGNIFRTEWVKGELLKKDLVLDLKLPTITETITSTQTITNTIRSPVALIRDSSIKVSPKINRRARSPYKSAGQR
jgi:hypothetical protein